MPNELKICSGFSTSNLFHPADHYTPLRTDPPPELELELIQTQMAQKPIMRAEDPPPLDLEG
jgi:hypothetical protein